MELLTKEEFYEFVQDYERLTDSSIRTAENIQSVCLRLEPFIPSESPADAWNVSLIIDKYSDSTELSEDSKRSYLSRFNSAVSKFVAYKKGEDVKGKPRRLPKPQYRKQEVQKDDSVKTFTLPIPLRGDLIVTIGNLPRDLTKDEAKRISLIVESFAMIDGGIKE